MCVQGTADYSPLEVLKCRLDRGECDLGLRDGVDDL